MVCCHVPVHLPQDPDLRAAVQLLQQGLEAQDVVTEEATWTRIIDTYGNMDKPWVPDVVSGVLGPGSLNIIT